MTTVNFKRPELTDRDIIDSYFKKYPSRSCDRTFANVYLWARFYEVEFAQYNNVLLFRDNSAGYGYAFPAGEDEDVKAAIEDILEWEKEKGVPFCLYGVTKENFAKLEAWFPGKFDITYHRDEADYVYESEKLATLSGKKLHGKRNHVNKFKALHGDNWSYETITEDNLEECFQMALKWRNLNGCEDDEEKNSEMCVTLNSLRLYKELNLTGGLLRVGD